jgi:peptide deformylase
VTTFDAELRRLVRNLDQTLSDHRGSGLGAPQGGVSQRVFVCHAEDVSGHLTAACSTKPTTSTASCSSTAWTSTATTELDQIG